jgi:hypothetical protein
MGTKYNPAEIQEVEILKPTRVKEHGKDMAEHFKPGQVVKVSGNDKSQLLASGHGKLKEVEVPKGK